MMKEIDFALDEAANLYKYWLELKNSAEQFANSFDKTKAELAEKYKLTPADEQQNRAAKLAKEWGTNPNAKFVTPYSKAMEAGEAYAHLLMQEEDYDLSSAKLSVSLMPFGSANVKDIVEDFSTKEELKKFLKENNIDVSNDLKEETVVAIIDKFPDFFEDIEFSFTEKEEKTVKRNPSLKDIIFSEAPMLPATDTIKYVCPVYNDDPSVKMVSDDTQQKTVDSVPKKLLTFSSPKPVKETKLSWKQQQRMKDRSPMWKSKC